MHGKLSVHLFLLLLIPPMLPFIVANNIIHCRQRCLSFVVNNIFYCRQRGLTMPITLPLIAAGDAFLGRRRCCQLAFSAVLFSGFSMPSSVARFSMRSIRASRSGCVENS